MKYNNDNIFFSYKQILYLKYYIVNIISFNIIAKNTDVWLVIIVVVQNHNNYYSVCFYIITEIPSSCLLLNTTLNVVYATLNSMHNI